MKFVAKIKRQAKEGYALLMVMLFTGMGLLVLSGAMDWTSSNARMTERSNQYYNTVAAAEAATEKIVGKISYDFQQGDQSTVAANMSNYKAMVPTTSESSYWNNFAFSDPSGNANQTLVTNISSWGYYPLNSQYTGLYGLAATYRVVSNVKQKNTLYTNMPAVGLMQEVQVATIPVFQFAIFYGITMEISCGKTFNITGRVHANKDMYVNPDSSLIFWSHVTAVGNINFSRAPGDSRGAPAGSVTYNGAHDSKVAALSLPIGTNNDATAVRALLSVPPSGEDPNSLIGKQRFYNKADLILTVSNYYTTNYTNQITINTNTTSTNINTTGVTTNTVQITKTNSFPAAGTYVPPITTNSGPKYTYLKITGYTTNYSTNFTYAYVTNTTPVISGISMSTVLGGKSGIYNNSATTIPGADLAKFTSTSASFQDNRESKTVLPLDIDVAKLKKWGETNTILGRPIKTLYIDDERSFTDSTQLSAERLLNGSTLPTNGFTVVTADPLYVQGNYNVVSANLGTTNTSGTVGAALICDAITELSTTWSDANSSLDISSRNAGATTVNAAILSGIVETLTFNSYSGGTENFPRFLENWSNVTNTYNGSMVIMFPSQYATNKWGQGNVYNPPARNWAFDLNFMDATKLPPGTPSVSTLIRGQWSLLAAGQTGP